MCLTDYIQKKTPLSAGQSSIVTVQVFLLLSRLFTVVVFTMKNSRHTDYRLTTVYRGEPIQDTEKTTFSRLQNA